MSSNRKQLATGLRAILGGANAGMAVPAQPAQDAEVPAQNKDAAAPAEVTGASAVAPPAAEPRIEVTEEPLVATAPVAATVDDGGTGAESALATNADEPAGTSLADDSAVQRPVVHVTDPDAKVLGPVVRKQRKKGADVPSVPVAPIPQLVPQKRVGTLDNPYVRQRDNQPTRKVGVVLPIDLAERMQIYCVKARLRPNEFVEKALTAMLEQVED